VVLMQPQGEVCSTLGLPRLNIHACLFQNQTLQQRTNLFDCTTLNMKAVLSLESSVTIYHSSRPQYQEILICNIDKSVIQTSDNNQFKYVIYGTEGGQVIGQSFVAIGLAEIFQSAHKGSHCATDIFCV
jgi:hypothetical protein